MPGVVFRREILRRTSLQVADFVVRSPAARQWLLRRGERALYEYYCAKAGEGGPSAGQAFQYRAIVNLLRAIDRAVADGRVGPSARRGILEVLVGEMVSRARTNVAPFIARHGVAPPAFLVVSPTQQCNLYCRGCYACSSSKTPATLSYAVFKRLLEDKRDDWGSHFTVVSGGEPTLYRSEGKTIYDVFAEFPDNYFLMFSNGTTIDSDVAKRLAELGNVTVAIAVEGSERDTDECRGRGVHRKAERAMGLLRRAGVPFGISMTVTRENADELMQDEIVDHYVEEMGAIYFWWFHYMPIGRTVDTRLMMTPQQRMRLLDRQLDLVENRGLFFLDLWNGGPTSSRCSAAGRPGGYFSVDWNGDIQPCVFVPFSVDNIYRVYESGRTLTSILSNPAFSEWRQFQARYADGANEAEARNPFAPCLMRDHYDVARDLLTRHRAKPINPDAAEAMRSSAYRARMLQYGREVGALLEEEADGGPCTQTRSGPPPAGEPEDQLEAEVG